MTPAVAWGDGLVAVADMHGVASQLAAMMRRNGTALKSEPFAEVLRQTYHAHLISTMELIGELFRVLEILNAEQISAAVVKGPVLSARAFGDPSVRQYRDIDFLLRNADIARATQLLTAAGFKPTIPAERIKLQKRPGQHLFRRSEESSLIELHTERTLRYFPRQLPIDDFFERRTTVSIDGRSVPALSLEDEFVLISIHGAKHFWERLMWIADVAALIHHRPKIDWGRVQLTAAHVGAQRMVRVALLLAERLLAVPVPQEMKEDVERDSACPSIVKKIESWLPFAGLDPPPLLQRAVFRFQVRGHALAGAGYLTRLSLSATEEDWIEGSNSRTASLRESLRRPFRLAKKYRKACKEQHKR